MAVDPKKGNRKAQDIIINAAAILLQWKKDQAARNKKPPKGADVVQDADRTTYGEHLLEDEEEGEAAEEAAGISHKDEVDTQLEDYDIDDAIILEPNEDEGNNDRVVGRRPKPGKKDKSFSLGEFLHAKNIRLPYDPVSGTFEFFYGCQINGDIKVEPATDASQEEIDFCKDAMSRRNMDPSDEELERINCFTNRPHAKGELRVMLIKAADTKLDRSQEHFHVKALEDMAEQFPGKPIMDDHNVLSVNATFGKCFDARVVRSKEGPVLMLKAYCLENPGNPNLIPSLEAGIGAQASVHFRSRTEDYKCDACNKPMFSEKGHCGHYVGYSKNADGTPVTATIMRVSDSLECSRTAAPDQPATAMKMFADAARAKSVGPVYTVNDARKMIGLPPLNPPEGQAPVAPPPAPPEPPKIEKPLQPPPVPEWQKSFASFVAKLNKTVKE